jgi:Epoxide hydrolase N terminus
MGRHMFYEFTPFRIDVSEADLRDLRERLRRTRWPERETVEDWSQGVPLAYLRDLCGYWAEEYDWRATETRLNALQQFRTRIDGLGIHFLHVPSPHAEYLPLVITHGWPGSIIEFLKVIGPLTDPTEHGGEVADGSTSSVHRCRATASATSPSGRAGVSSGSPPPGPA